MQAFSRRASRRKSSKVPTSLQCHDPGLSQYYYSRRQSRRLSTNDLPMELDAVGLWSPWALLWLCCFMVAPVAYVYILLMLLRDLCQYFPETVYQPLEKYTPWLAQLANLMNNASRIVDVWCVIEALFFVACKLKIQYLQRKDPLEASLSAAPMLDPEDRRILWERMMDAEKDDPASFISGWFFDQPIEKISRYDVCDFLCWSLFDGRNQEHLTTDELHDLEYFLEDLEYQISLKLHGVGDVETLDQADSSTDGIRNKFASECESPQKVNRSLDFEDDNSTIASFSETGSSSWQRRPRPNKMFRFSVDTQREKPTFFSNLYESYKNHYGRYKHMMENSKFQPIKDIRNMLAETAQQAEESATATAHMMYEALVQPGSNMDKQISAISHRTAVQLTETWNSVRGMKERIETATFLSERRNALMEQLRGNRAMLSRMREMSYAVSSEQMATLLRRITECSDALERVELIAKEGFIKATGTLTEHGSSFFSVKEPQPYAKYSSDPLLGIATYPLGFHMLVLGATEIPLRTMLKNRGFERRFVGPITYYYYPGSKDKPADAKELPIVFVHGIGIGLLSYVPLIDHFLESGRPILLPEIPYVSGFRPWVSPNSVLSPAVVTSSVTAMLATHGFSKAIFSGHSYGTSWLSYMCKYAPSGVAGFLFLDPICFCLHYSRLTKNFVYHRPDPGTVSYMIRTDMIVNWTIQRAFPWSWINLFVEHVKVPCIVFLNDKDALVPVPKVQSYLKGKDVAISDVEHGSSEEFPTDFEVRVFRGTVHGAFTEEPDLLHPIAHACRCLCEKVEAKHFN